VSDTLRLQLQTALGSAYTLERELGGGGMSRVFLATEAALGRRIVIKLLPPELAASVSTERFKREIQLAARLQHPHIVPLLTAGESDGLPYFTMPFVEGESLRARLATRGELPVAEAVRVLRELASALAYAHAHGVVHRDIKPDNVLLSGGAAMVTDFGVAKALSASTTAEPAGSATDSVTSLGVALGTPAYMAPEQASADPNVDHRADVYAFGILAYELLTGQTPFGGRTPQGLLAAHVNEAPEPIQKRRALAPALAALVMRCLEKRPSDRPQTAEEIVHALDDLTTPSGGMAPTSVGSPVAGAGVERRVTTGSGSRSRSLAALAAAALLATVGVFAWQRSRAPAAVTAPEARSVAVLPFENIGSDTSNAYFSDGMTDEVTIALDKLPGLRVASRGSAFAFKGKAVDARDIGRQLGVTHIVEGSVRRAAGRLRLSARLVSTSNNYEVWSQSYDRDVSDVFAVQDELARAIAGELDASLRGARQAPASGGTTNLAAYDLYLRGRYLWNHRTAAGLELAARAFSEATRLDPDYALAYAGLADVYTVAPQYSGRPRADFYSRAESAARKALALDSTLAEPHATLGLLADQARRYAEAERELRRAIAMKPTYPTAHHWYALALRRQGRLEESRVHYEEARRLDPLSPIIATVYASSFYFERDYPRAISELEQVLQLHPGFAEANRYLARTYGVAGDLPRALATIQRAAAASGLPEQGDLGWILGRMGRHHEGDSLLADARARAARGPVPSSTFALIHLGRGRLDSAFIWLERAADSTDPAVAYMKIDPRFEALRSDPRFHRILKRINLE
jgi:TolB-like protein/Flp pilus assembly protein TadD/tRNA A-37 threonylcarbamoyl transferase component Bud32